MKTFFIYLKLISLCLIGATAVKIWVVFVRVWMHGGSYRWGWIGAKFILVNGGLLAVVFCILATVVRIGHKP